MKILQIDIKGFGKLENFSIEPSGGFNLVFGLNESGKSTLQAFVLSMLYGLTKKENEKYSPWHAADFAGSMLYMLDDGLVYKVERDFRNNSFYLYDSKGQMISADSRSCEKHVGVNIEMFKASAYMEQSKVMFDDDLKDKISRRLKKIYKYESETAADTDIRQTDLKLEKKLNIIKRNYNEILSIKAQKENVSTDEDIELNNTEEHDELLDLLITLKNKQISFASKKNYMLLPFFILCLAAVISGIYSYQIALGILSFAFVVLIINGVIILSRKISKNKLDKRVQQIAKRLNVEKDIELSQLFSMKHSDIKKAEDKDTIDEDGYDERIALKFASIKLNADKDIKAIDDVPAYIDELEAGLNEILRGTDDTKTHTLAEKIIKAAGAGAGDGMTQLADELTRIIKLITSDRYERFLSENKDFMLFSSDIDSYTDIDTLSTGTMEQLYIALRLAVTELLSKKGEKLPVFMDEVFAHTDEKRIYDTVRYIKMQKDPTQTFYFTCRRTEGSLIRAIIGEDTNIIKLKV